MLRFGLQPCASDAQGLFVGVRRGGQIARAHRQIAYEAPSQQVLRVVLRSAAVGSQGFGGIVVERQAALVARGFGRLLQLGATLLLGADRGGGGGLFRFGE